MMLKEKVDTINEVDDEHSKNLNLISKSMDKDIKPLSINLASKSTSLKPVNVHNIYSKELDKTMKSIAKTIEQINEIHEDIIQSIQPVLKSISNIKFPKLDIDFSELKIYAYRIEFEEKKDIIDEFYKNTIFPPIGYLIKNDINEINIKSCEEWILNDKGLKKFYIDSIDKWKNKYDDDNIKRMIEEIKFNFEYRNSYSVCTLVAIVIEYMLNQNYSEKIKSHGGRYSSIRNVLNEKVFEPINIEKLYIRFIKDNLYADTNKAEEFSRHMAHGDKIEFGNMKSAMNMIFIYDFLQDVMIVN